MPHTNPSTLFTLDELLLYNDHTRRPRLSRFWRMAGPLVTAQVLFLTILFSLLLLSALAQGDYLIAFASFLAPAVAAYLARPILLLRPATTAHLMNAAAAASIIYALLIHNPKAPTPSPLAYLVLAYLSFHISAIFWLLSDASIYPNRKRWWHR